MDDDGQVVLGEGVGQVGDDHQDGGRQEGGQQAARQRPGELEDNLDARLLALEWFIAPLTCCHKMSKLVLTSSKVELHILIPVTVYCSNFFGPRYVRSPGTRLTRSSF